MKYRADLDGIRAIAIALVIFFHYGASSVTGGYIGVDVFFVLSGYLIGSNIFSQLDKNSFRFVTFYFRRLRRLFPAYAAMIVVTFLFAYWIMLPLEFREFGQSLVASTIYLSNVLFYFESGYHDASAHTKPLLHTWSLSVEEQFYVIFPIVAFLAGTYLKRHLAAIIVSLTLISFLFGVFWISRDTSAVFYLYPFRAWELFLGVILALKIVPNFPGRRTCAVAAFVGLMLVIVPAVIYDSTTPFPGVAALWPCLGTVLLIHAGTHQNWASSLLSRSLPVFTGKISYALYLWHWPVYVLYVYAIAREPGLYDSVLMLSLTVVASLVSYYFIESPIRYGTLSFANSISKVFTATAAASVAAIAAGLYIHTTNGMPSRLDARTNAFAAAAGDLFGDLSDCETFGNEVLANIEYCTVGDPLTAEEYTLVWGDSHAGMYRPGYSEVLSGNQFDSLIAWTGGCPPVFGLAKDETASSATTDEKCYYRNEAIRDLIDDDARINSVVLLGRWSYYLHGSGIGVDDHNKIEAWPMEARAGHGVDQDQYVASALTNTIAELSARNIRVFVIEQPPEFSSYRAQQVAIGMMRGVLDDDQLGNLTQEPYSGVMHRQGLVQAALDKLEQDGHVTVLRTHHYFCEPEFCSLMLDGLPAYFDNNHISTEGSLRISDMFYPVRTYLEQRSEKLAYAAAGGTAERKQ